ncbi:MAG: hypothetical protein KatS3mg115_1718 [Candidatus Poribacteria bacterium]|nr:MAG: hypothetical protein KatS3mg115_1718 [Candidatus Poribacteria bacterium]
MLYPPEAGEGVAWFDSLRLIEWEVPRPVPFSLRTPNDKAVFRLVGTRQETPSAWMEVVRYRFIPPIADPSETLASDLNGDGVVDIMDLVTVARAFGTRGVASAGRQ